MAQQTLSTFSAALRDDYLPAVREQIENATVLLKRLKRAPMSGNQEVIVLRSGRNPSVGAAADGATLVAADYQRYTQSTISRQQTYGRVRVTGPTIAASKGSGAVVAALTGEVERITDDLAHDMNRQFFGSGTGVLTTVTTGTASATQTVGDTSHLYAGRVLYFGTAATTGTVSTVDSATQITLTASVTTTTGESIYHSGAQTANTEMMGLEGIVDDSTNLATLQGVARATNTWWNANRVDNSGSGNVDLTLDLMQQSLTAAEEEGGMVSLILCRHAIRDAYREIVVSDKRFVNTMTLDGGFMALEYNGIPVVPDRQAPANTMYFIDERHIKLYVLKDVSFSEMVPVTNVDAIESVVSFYGNLGADNCNRHCVLKEVQ